jgi:hypothetical protein
MNIKLFTVIYYYSLYSNYYKKYGYQILNYSLLFYFYSLCSNYYNKYEQYGYFLFFSDW